MPESEYYVEEEGGEIEVEYLSNREGTVSLINPSDNSWVKLGATVFNGDGSLPVTVQPNEGFKRRADLLFCTENRKDTVALLQYGPVEEKFYVSIQWF